MTSKNPLRSQAWFGRQDKMGFYYRSWLKNRGFPQDQFDGRLAIAICNTWSELNPCNSHFKTVAEHVRWGVLEAGGFPLEFPVMALGETMLRRTAMLFRNLASMDVEESIRGYAKLYIDHVLQADEGADLDFLVGRSGSPVPRDNH